MKAPTFVGVDRDKGQIRMFREGAPRGMKIGIHGGRGATRPTAQRIALAGDIRHLPGSFYCGREAAPSGSVNFSSKVGLATALREAHVHSIRHLAGPEDTAVREAHVHSVRHLAGPEDTAVREAHVHSVRHLAGPEDNPLAADLLNLRVNASGTPWPSRGRSPC